MSELDPGALIEKQKAHREQKQKEQADQARAQQEQEELQTQAGPLVKERQDLLKEAKVASARLAELRTENIEQRLANAEQIKTNIDAREEQLQLTREQLSDLSGRIKAVEDSFEEGEDIDPEVQSNLDAARQELSNLQTEEQKITTEIANLTDETLNDEVVAEYKALIKQIAELDQRIEEIEANPYVIELIYREAGGTPEQKGHGGENGIRNQLVASLEGAPGYGGTREQGSMQFERRNYLRTLAQKFFQEELDHTGINEIENPQERLQKMQELAINMTIAMKNPGHTYGTFVYSGGLTNQERTQQGAGIALMNIAGKYGTVGPMVYIDAGKVDPRYRDQQVGKKLQRESVIEHIGSINYILANAEGWGPRSRDITTLGNYQGSQSSELRETLRGLGFKDSEGIIIPQKPDELRTHRPELVGKDEAPISAAKIDELRSEYQRYFLHAEQSINDHIDKEERAVQELSDQIAELNRTKESAKQYQAELDEIAEDLVPIGASSLAIELDKKSAQLEAEIIGINNLIKNNEGQRYSLFDRQGRREHAEFMSENRSRFDSKRRELGNVRQKLKRLSQMKEKYSGLKNLNPIEIAKQIAQAESTLKDREANLNALKRAVTERRKGK